MQMTSRRSALLLALACALSRPAGAQLPPSEELIGELLQLRQKLFDARGIDVPALSREIAQVLGECQRLADAQRYQDALEQLRTLERHMPLSDFPSYNVHVVAASLYGRLNDPQARERHAQRALAYRAILRERIGSGSGPRDPLRVVMANEVFEWLTSQSFRLAQVHPVPAPDRSLMIVSYRRAPPDDALHALLVEMDPRTTAMAARSRGAGR